MAGRNVRAEGGGVDVDRVPTRRLDDLDAGRQQLLAQVLLVDNLFEALGHGFQVAAGQPAVRNEAFGENQQLVCPAH